MSEEGGSSPWKWIGIGCGVLALIGVCLLGSCVACGGMGAVGVFAALEAPANEAKGLLADVRGQRFDAAYGRMSPTYQASHDAAAFTAQVQAIPALTSMTDDTISQRNVSGATARMSGTLQTPTGDVPVAFALSQLGERWVVDSIDVAGATIP
ncbi:MAG: hypothetical protein M3Y87_09875 [Myxococcota bacterium]|nr:hypothetical protein [Myxococcota bacterium]